MQLPVVTINRRINEGNSTEDTATGCKKVGARINSGANLSY